MEDRLFNGADSASAARSAPADWERWIVDHPGRSDDRNGKCIRKMVEQGGGPIRMGGTSRPLTGQEYAVDRRIAVDVNGTAA